MIKSRRAAMQNGLGSYYKPYPMGEIPMLNPGTDSLATAKHLLTSATYYPMPVKMDQKRIMRTKPRTSYQAAEGTWRGEPLPIRGAALARRAPAYTAFAGMGATKEASLVELVTGGAVTEARQTAGAISKKLDQAKLALQISTAAAVISTLVVLFRR